MTENQKNEYDIQVQKLKLKRQAIESITLLAATVVFVAAIIVILAMKWGVLK
ncbi:MULTISPECIES: hypothetical protein [Acinetobacter]|uniref:hypothetical protein n=1 Tax=Acinetobacter TaxID=469 RepID=UPI0015D10162|nr:MULTISPECIES: hypothetical protein [Acinetobacter]WOE29689.1 hypothetical protein QSG83_05845 [Acinetobacter towneri]